MITPLPSSPSADPPAGGLRERKKRQTRRALHLAARELVAEHGLAGVTVEEICAAADVSPRTFFNYFPTKAAAALGLPETVIDPVAAERFRSGTGTLIDDLCDYFAASAPTEESKDVRKNLVRRHPDLVPALTEWIFSMREETAALVHERAENPEADLALALVMAAAVQSRLWSRDETLADGGAGALRDTVRAMAALVAPVAEGS